MPGRLKTALLLFPAAAMAVLAAAVWYRAGQGGFNSMMGFPVVFAALTTVMVAVAYFVGPRPLRKASAGLLLVAALLGWGATWSHHGYFERQRETLDQRGREAFAGRTLEPIPFLHAVNLADPETPRAYDFEKPHVLVNIWATWCSPCVREMPMLERFWQDHRASGLEIVGVIRLTAGDERTRVEELAGIETFVADRGVSYPILVVDGDVYDRFDAQRLPTSLWIENGTVEDYRVTVEGTEALLEAIEGRLQVGM